MHEYLFLRREGIVFDGLMRHISHHSLANLLIELLQIQIKPEESRQKKISLSYHNSDGSDNEQDDPDNDDVALTAEQ